MNVEEYRNYCLSKKGVEEDFPFDENTLVFKVMGKLFALANINGFGSINLKCEPMHALELRERYAAVEPGYHMSKKHWNTVTVGHDASDQEIYSWIDDSYALVVQGLTKKLKSELADLS
jgi:predicted DNA-binding protein (MmcQ/YjbR family)